MKKRNMKGVVTSLLLVIGFAVLYLPPASMYILHNLLQQIEISALSQNIFNMMTCCAAIVDVGIYAVRNNDVRAIFITIYHKTFKRYTT